VAWPAINGTAAPGSNGGDDDLNIKYDLYADQVDGDQNKYVATFDSHILAYEMTGLTLGEPWYFKLYTRNRGEFRSAPANFSTNVSSVPEAPTGVTITAQATTP